MFLQKWSEFPLKGAFSAFGPCGCGSTPFWDPILVGIGEFTAQFRLYFSGWIESDVHWGYDLDFDPWPYVSVCFPVGVPSSGRHPAPPKKPWNNGFAWFLRWCEMDFATIHSTHQKGVVSKKTPIVFRFNMEPTKLSF